MFVDLCLSSLNRRLFLYCLCRTVRSLSRPRDTELTSAREAHPNAPSNSRLNFQGPACLRLFSHPETAWFLHCSAGVHLEPVQDLLDHSTPCANLATFHLPRHWCRAAHVVGGHCAHEIRTMWNSLNCSPFDVCRSSLLSGYNLKFHSPPRTLASHLFSSCSDQLWLFLPTSLNLMKCVRIWFA